MGANQFVKLVGEVEEIAGNYDLVGVNNAIEKLRKENELVCHALQNEQKNGISK